MHAMPPPPERSGAEHRPAAAEPVDPLADLRRRFLARSRQRLDELTAIVAAPTLGPPALERLVRLAHQLAGSAGTFGCAELGRAAARLEDAAVEQAATAGGRPLPPRLAGILAARLAVVEAALEAQRTATPAV